MVYKGVLFYFCFFQTENQDVSPSGLVFNIFKEEKYIQKPLYLTYLTYQFARLLCCAWFFFEGKKTFKQKGTHIGLGGCLQVQHSSPELHVASGMGRGGEKIWIGTTTSAPANNNFNFSKTNQENTRLSKEEKQMKSKHLETHKTFCYIIKLRFMTVLHLILVDALMMKTKLPILLWGPFQLPVLRCLASVTYQVFQSLEDCSQILS